MMRLLKSILDFYIRSSLHVAVCFVALSIVYNESYEFHVPFDYYIFLFCAALSGYNLIKYGLLWLKVPLKSTLSIKIITLLSAFIALCSTFVFNIYAWLLLIITLMINFLYTVPVWKGKGLRYSPFFKLFSVAIVWAILIIAIPQFINYDASLNLSDLKEFRLGVQPNEFIELHTFKIFILILALCIPFEIRDLKYDDEILQTLPQVLGVFNSKVIGLILCSLYLVLVFYIGTIQSTYDFTEVIMIFTIAIAIWFSDKFKSDYYASFFVEAIPLLWLGLYNLL